MTRELCIMACTFCRDRVFLRWLESFCPDGITIPFTEDMAKTYILEACGINSRNELDTDPAAAAHFHELVRLPFLAWREDHV